MGANCRIGIKTKEKKKQSNLKNEKYKKPIRWKRTENEMIDKQQYLIPVPTNPIKVTLRIICIV